MGRARFARLWKAHKGGRNLEILTFFLVLYAIVTFSALLLTFREHRIRGARSSVHLIGGYLLCTVWPAVVAVMVIFYRSKLQDS